MQIGGPTEASVEPDHRAEKAKLLVKKINLLASVTQPEGYTESGHSL